MAVTTSRPSATAGSPGRLFEPVPGGQQQEAHEHLARLLRAGYGAGTCATGAGCNASQATALRCSVVHPNREPADFSKCLEACRMYSRAQQYDSSCTALYDSLSKRYPSDPEFTAIRLGTVRARLWSLRLLTQWRTCSQISYADSCVAMQRTRQSWTCCSRESSKTTRPYVLNHGSALHSAQVVCVDLQGAHPLRGEALGSTQSVLWYDPRHGEHAAGFSRFKWVWCRNAGKYKMVHGEALEGIGWMMYVLRLAHTPEYMAKVLLAIADAFLELGRFPGTA